MGKWRRGKAKLAPQVAPTPLDGLDAITSLIAHSDEELRVELQNAATTESWMRTFAQSYKGQEIAEGEQLIAVLEKAATYARITREVIAMNLVLREDKGKGNSPKGYL